MIAVVNTTQPIQLGLDSLRIDGGTQSRVKLHVETVNEYAEQIKDGDTFPPVDAFYDGVDYWLADGFHRAAAHRQAGKLIIMACVHQGTRRDALLHSVGANAGPRALPRTHADKRRAVEALLRDSEWVRWSDREIARRCGVHNSFVSRLRNQLSLSDSSELTETTTEVTSPPVETARNEEKRQSADGKVRRLPRKAESQPESEPVAPDAEPVRRTSYEADKHAKVKELTEAGLPPSEIAKEIGKPVHFVNHSKRSQGLTRRDENPLSKLVEFADEVADFWTSATSNFLPQWDEATAEQRKEATDQIERSIKASHRLIQRLNKEAKRNAS